MAQDLHGLCMAGNSANWTELRLTAAGGVTALPGSDVDCSAVQPDGIKLGEGQEACGVCGKAANLYSFYEQEAALPAGAERRAGIPLTLDETLRCKQLEHPTLGRCPFLL